MQIEVGGRQIEVGGRQIEVGALGHYLGGLCCGGRGMGGSAMKLLATTSFSSRSGLGIAMPPTRPPTRPSFGSYCFRATCGVVREGDPPNACPVAKVSGYDKHPGVGKDTEYVCGAHARALGGGYRCLPAEVVLLPRSDTECSGQVFWSMDGKTMRLV